MSDENDDGYEDLKLEEIGKRMTLEDIQNWVAQKAAVMHKQPLQKAVAHKLVFEVAGKVGERKVITVMPECYFRGESIDAKDTLDGAGTKIDLLLVGKKLQRINRGCTFPETRTPLQTRELMRAIRDGSLKFEMDTCQPGLSICIGILFTHDCEFRAEISGRAAGL